MQTVTDVIGYDLTHCSFGKVWTRLTFSKLNSTVHFDTDNLVLSAACSDKRTVRANLPSIFDALEMQVSDIQVHDGTLVVVLSTGEQLSIVRDGQSTDSLLKVTEAETGHWLTID